MSPPSVRRRPAGRRATTQTGKQQQHLLVQQTPGWQASFMVVVALSCVTLAFLAILNVGSLDDSSSSSSSPPVMSRQNNDKEAQSYGIPPWMIQQGEIPRKQWSDVVASQGSVGRQQQQLQQQQHEDVSSALAALREPVIITADEWPAMAKWKSEEYLARTLGTLHKVKRGIDPLFIYTNADGSLLAPEKRRSLHIPDHVGVVSPDTAQRVNVTIADFFSCKDSQCASGANVSAARKLDPLYYSRVLNTAEDFGKLVKDDVSGTIADFVVWDDWRACFPNCSDQDDAAGKGAEYHAWVGHPGVITGAHYDSSHNCFIQIRGTKRFVVASPHEWTKMRLYSAWHPRARQSQQDAYSLDRQVFSGDDTREADRVFAHEPASRDQVVDVMVATLNPGDVLYLPPMYFHRVSALPGDFALAVNIWSSSKEEILADKLGAQELPDALTKITPASAPLRPAVLAVLVKELVRGVLLSLQEAQVPALDFVANLRDELALSRRSNQPEREDTGVEVIISSSDNEEEQQVAAFIALLVEQRYLYRPEFGESIGCGAWKPGRCPREHHLSANTVTGLQSFVEERLLPPFKEYVEQITKATAQPPQQATAGVATLILLDYLEKIVAFTVSLPKSCLYFRCLAEVHSWGHATWLE